MLKNIFYNITLTQWYYKYQYWNQYRMFPDNGDNFFREQFKRATLRGHTKYERNTHKRNEHWRAEIRYNL